MALAPILSWEGLGLIQGSGWLFQDLNINVGPRDRLALIAAGSAFIYCPLGFVTYLAPSIYLSVTTLTLQSIFYFMIFTPGYSLAMDIADARIRARTAALVSMGATAIGYGLGPQIEGVLSDRFSTFAGAASLRYALVVMTLVALWSGAHFLQAWRKLRPTPVTQ